MSISRYIKTRDVIKRHDSPEAYLEFIREHQVHKAHFCGTEGYKDYFYGMPFDKALHTLEHGDISSAENAQKIMDKMDELEVFSIGRSIIDTQIVGFAPNVPAVIAGMPETMFNRTMLETENTYAPISIYVETMCNAQFSAEMIFNRGVAILAFVLAMNTVRPISLFAITSTGVDGDGYSNVKNCANVVQITTNPLDLGRAAWMLTSNAYNRRIGFCTATYLGFGYTGRPQTLPQTFGNQSSDVYEASMRDALSLEPTDVLIRGGSAYSDKMVYQNPVQWVKNMIEKHATKGI